MMIRIFERLLRSSSRDTGVFSYPGLYTQIFLRKFEEIQASGKYMAQHINGARELVLPSVAYLPSMEEQQPSNDNVLSFLAQL